MRMLVLAAVVVGGVWGQHRAAVDGVVTDEQADAPRTLSREQRAEYLELVVAAQAAELEELRTQLAARAAIEKVERAREEAMGRIREWLAGVAGGREDCTPRLDTGEWVCGKPVNRSVG